METEIKEKKQLLSNALCNCSKTIHLNTNQIFGIIDEDKKRIFLIFLNILYHKSFYYYIV